MPLITSSGPRMSAVRRARRRLHSHRADTTWHPARAEAPETEHPPTPDTESIPDPKPEDETPPAERGEDGVDEDEAGRESFPASDPPANY